MNWTKAFLAGAIGGVVIWLVDYVLHGVIMANTYVKYPEVFTQEQGNIFDFLLVEVFIGVSAALLFAKTRSTWASGWAGGASFGVFLGLVLFWLPFFDALVIDGFPYYMAWCHGAMNLIAATILGAVLGAVIKH